MISIVGVRIYSIWDIVGMALDYLIKEASVPDISRNPQADPNSETQSGN